MDTYNFHSPKILPILFNSIYIINRLIPKRTTINHLSSSPPYHHLRQNWCLCQHLLIINMPPTKFTTTFALATIINLSHVIDHYHPFSNLKWGWFSNTNKTLIHHYLLHYSNTHLLLPLNVPSISLYPSTTTPTTTLTTQHQHHLLLFLFPEFDLKSCKDSNGSPTMTMKIDDNMCNPLY